jgi:hypothetical protein
MIMPLFRSVSFVCRDGLDDALYKLERVLNPASSRSPLLLLAGYTVKPCII